MIVRTFKIYPDNRWLYFVVHIHHNPRAMYKACADVEPDFRAICRACLVVNIPSKKDRRKPYYTGHIGDLHFTCGEIGAGIVSHECAHAAHAYFRFRSGECRLPEFSGKSDGRWVSEKEEKLCFVIGNLTSQFFRNWYAKRTPRSFFFKVPLKAVTFRQARKYLKA